MLTQPASSQDDRLGITDIIAKASNCGTIAAELTVPERVLVFLPRLWYRLAQGGRDAGDGEEDVGDGSDRTGRRGTPQVMVTGDGAILTGCAQHRPGQPRGPLHQGNGSGGALGSRGVAELQ
jgi:hypothetical protein